MSGDADAMPSATRPTLVDQRLVSPLPGLTTGGWQLKVYGIAYQRDEPRPELVAAARATAAAALPQPARDHGSHGAGFLVVHDGAVACWSLLFWWSDHILLRQRLFRSTADAPGELTPVTDGLVACVYELQVIAWEREAWLRHVLTGPGDIQAYLADQHATHPAIGWPPAL